MEVKNPNSLQRAANKKKIWNTKTPAKSIKES